MSLTIYTYNLLSPKLYHSDILTTEVRWAMIRKRLLIQIPKECIFCLQELSQEWIFYLIPFFSGNGYTFIYDSKYLGVGIAFPTTKYSLASMNMIYIGDALKERCTIEKRNMRSIKTKFIRKCSKLIPQDVWLQAITKRKRLLGLTLIDVKTSKQFNVFTYQMPFIDVHRHLMNIHAAVLLTVVQEISGVYPYIITGDFNSIPQSSVYSMITEGKVPNFPRSTLFDSVPNFEGKINPLQSAYVTLTGQEPVYTRVEEGKYPRTNDYIFHTTNLVIKDVLPVRNNLADTVFPNSREPSDHLPLGATFTLTQ